MLCYKDMTFCPFWEDCIKQIDCPRCLNDNVLANAERVGLPICRFVEKPDCFEGENNVENHRS